MESKLWNIFVRSRKDLHQVEASTAEELDGRLVLKDGEGTTVGSYFLTEIQGYSVHQETRAIAVRFVRGNGESTPENPPGDGNG